MWIIIVSKTRDQRIEQRKGYIANNYDPVPGPGKYIHCGWQKSKKVKKYGRCFTNKVVIECHSYKSRNNQQVFPDLCPVNPDEKKSQEKENV
jgi:hypothetical protein